MADTPQSLAEELRGLPWANDPDRDGYIIRESARALLEQSSKLSEALKARDFSEQCLHALQEKFGAQSRELVGAMDRLEEGLNDGEELRQKGRDAWEVLERYLADAHNLDINKMPGSDDMLIALTGILFVKPTAEDLEACRRDLIQAGIVETRGQTDEKGRPMTYWGGEVEIGRLKSDG